MDFFGIGTAVTGALHILFRSARATGRTTELLKHLRDGDMVVCFSQASARGMEHECRSRKLKVNVIANACDPGGLIRHGRSRPISTGRLIFDHDWLEQFYLQKIKDAGKEIDYLQAALVDVPEPMVPNRISELNEQRWRY